MVAPTHQVTVTMGDTDGSETKLKVGTDLQCRSVVPFLGQTCGQHIHHTREGGAVAEDRHPHGNQLCTIFGQSVLLYIRTGLPQVIGSVTERTAKGFTGTHTDPLYA